MVPWQARSTAGHGIRVPELLMRGKRMAGQKRVWTVAEITKAFKVDEQFIQALEEDSIICPRCGRRRSLRTFSSEEVEKLRLAKVLVEEMEVNLPGVEVILHMRQTMIDMRRQFDAILEDLARQIQKTVQKP